MTMAHMPQTWTSAVKSGSSLSQGAFHLVGWRNAMSLQFLPRGNAAASRAEPPPSPRFLYQLYRCPCQVHHHAWLVLDLIHLSQLLSRPLCRILLWFPTCVRIAMHDVAKFQ